jgi:hypothetical protein
MSNSIGKILRARTFWVGLVPFAIGVILTLLDSMWGEKSLLAVKTDILCTFFLTALSIGVEIFWHVHESMKHAVGSMSDTVNTVPSLIDAGIENAAIRNPSLIQESYTQVVRGILDIKNQAMKKEIIAFAKDALMAIHQKNGFSLGDQGFQSYKKAANLFCSAAERSLQMTCLYCPLQYFIDLIDPKRNDPDHLPIFNGMGDINSYIDNNGQPHHLHRSRIMCVRDRLQKNIEANPYIFAAAFVWFLFNNIHFDSLSWSSESCQDDIILIDETYMWRYLPNAKILYLRCEWDGGSGSLSATRSWLENLMEGADHGIHKHLLNIDASGALWDKFFQGLKAYIDAIIRQANEKNASLGLEAYAVIMTSYKKYLDNTYNEYRLLTNMKKCYHDFWKNNHDSARAFIGYMLNNDPPSFKSDTWRMLKTSIKNMIGNI